MPIRLSKAERSRFLKGRHVAVLATIGEAGEPVLTPIWCLYRRGQILMRTDEAAVKTKNIPRDPRVTVCVQDERPPDKSVTIHGRATIEPVDNALGLKIAIRNLGAIGGRAYMSVAAEQIQQGVEEITLVITPERALTQDFAAETPLVGRVWLQLRRILPPWL